MIFSVSVILQLKCVEGMGLGENSRVSHPTRRNTISGNVLSFLRLNMPPNRPPPNGGGRGRGEEEADDFLPFEEEVQRRSRHIAPNSGRFDSGTTTSMGGRKEGEYLEIFGKMAWILLKRIFLMRNKL